MRTTWSKYIIILLFAVAFLAACGQEELPVPTEQAPAAKSTAIAEALATNTPLPEPAATATETPAPTETLPPTATTEPTPTEEAVAEVTDKCLACHSDKDQLIDTVAPEEQAPSESSGVG